jgi:4-hydroxybutyrate CoA-transferase
MISLIVRRSRSSSASSFHCAQRHESNVACRSLNTKHLRSAPRVATSPQDAVRDVTHGSHVFIHSVAAAPQALVGGLMSRAEELRDPANPVQIYHIHTEGPTPYCDVKVKDSFFTNVLFTAANTREAVNDGRAAYIPCFLSEIPRLFLKGYVPLDVALLTVSPPDRHGYCSLGTSVDVSNAALRTAKFVVGQINRNMPRTHGDGLVHINSLDVVLESHDPIPEHHIGQPDDIERTIGRQIAPLVENGACLQLGIGSLPNAVLAELHSHRNLGIHTEMFSDGLLDLMASGAVNNAEKVFCPHQTVTTFVYGSRRLYDFIDDNPSVIMLRVEQTNNPAVIAQNAKVTAINSAIEVDLTGQVCADSIGSRIYSGVGGQVDFITGATRSEGGKAIIALPSQTSKGKSRIVAELGVGAGVVTTRAHVHYVATEYGVVDLFGKNMWERAEALISIAHPNHRESLARDLIKRAPHWRRHLTI